MCVWKEQVVAFSSTSKVDSYHLKKNDEKENMTMKFQPTAMLSSNHMPMYQTRFWSTFHVSTILLIPNRLLTGGISLLVIVNASTEKERQSVNAACLRCIYYWMNKMNGLKWEIKINPCKLGIRMSGCACIPQNHHSRPHQVVCIPSRLFPCRFPLVHNIRMLNCPIDRTYSP